ncbi:MAG: efflux RND transporter periplasmic adaptor subunit [Betaproteobacteria bacterium]|nr:efflux RND transporter periplasmic adaptor subunit [Betaproteobacteria bacterium]
MKKDALRIAMFFGAAALAVAAAGAGYWWGTRGQLPRADAAAKATPERKILYYRSPMNSGVTSPVPKKDEMGMDFVPVYADETAPEAKPKGRVLYYRNPMGLPDTSPVPKKDAMGMDYVPVYESDASARGQVALTPERVQKLGVKTETARLRTLTRTLRAVGTVQVDERRLHTVAPKFEGWIEKLHVNATGQAVARGEPLMEVYSPELVSAQREYAIALQGMQATQQGSPEVRADMARLAQSALQRLRNWDVSEQDLTRLREQDTARRALTLRAPASGVVLEKMAVAGMRFMPGEALYRIADLSRVWFVVQVYEQDLAAARVGQEARIALGAYPGRSFAGRVAFVYPTLSSDTRTAQVRIELPNPQGQLRPAMYGTAEIAAGLDQTPVLAVPSSAVIDSGRRQVVLVAAGEGRFAPREVKLGASAGEYVQVLEGIAEGENVVVSANFLIDAESNLKAALGGFGSQGAQQSARRPEAGTEPAPANRSEPGHAGH